MPIQRIAGSMIQDETLSGIDIQDGSVTKAELDAAVQASLDKADSAVQEVKAGSGITVTRSGSAVTVSGPTAFSSIQVGDTSLSASGITDRLKLKTGSYVTLTPDNTNNSITVDVTGVAPASHTHLSTEVTDLGSAALRNVGTQAGNVPVLGSGGKLDDSLIPNTILRLSGGTMTGALTLSGDPEFGLQAATKQYVDSRYAAVAMAKEFIATEGQTVFDISDVGAYVPGTNTIEVYVAGIRQHPSRYAETDKHTITLSEGLAAGTPVLLVWYQDSTVAVVSTLHAERHKPGGVDDLSGTYVARSALINNITNASGVTDLPPSADLLAKTHDTVASILDGRYTAANAAKLEGKSASYFATATHKHTAADVGAATPDDVSEAVAAHAGRTDNPHKVTAAQTGAVAKTGDTMTGPLVLSGDPTASLQAATKQYVDAGLSAKLDKTATAADASKLGGVAAANYARTDVAETFAGDVTVQGKLVVVGGIDQQNVTELSVQDTTIKLNSGLSASTPNASDAGIVVERGSLLDVAIKWNESLDTWQATRDGSTFRDLVLQGDNLTTGKIIFAKNEVATQDTAFDGSTGTGLKFANDYGYVTFTPLNDSWLHIYTDRPKVIFDKPVYSFVNKFSSYDDDLQLQRNGVTKLTVGDSQAAFTTPVVLPADPTANLQAATKQYVDSGLSKKANTSHTHAISDVANLQTALDSKANTGHGHAISDVSGLQAALDAKSAANHNHDSTYLKLSGGTLTGPLTIDTYAKISAETGLTTGRDVSIKTTEGSVWTEARILDSSSSSNLAGLLVRSSNNSGSTWTEIFQATGSAFTYKGGTVWHAGNFNPASKAEAAHTHAIEDVEGLAAALANQAAEDHTHDDRYYTEVEVNALLSTKADDRLATTSADGLMSSADKAKLDGIAEGATKVTKSSTNGNILINGTEVKVYTHPTDHDDRYYTETELQTSGQAQVHWGNITNKPSTYAPSAHTHSVTDVSGLQAALDSKVDSSEVATTATAGKLLKLNSNGALPASVTGNAATATKLQTARTIALSGGVTGSASFDGSANVTITATVANDGHTHDTRYVKLDGTGTMTGGLSLSASDTSSCFQVVYNNTEQSLDFVFMP